MPNKSQILDIDQVLIKLKPVTDKKFGLFHNLQLEQQYSDEPSFWYFSSNLNNKFTKHDGKEFFSHASGTSFFSPKEALIKCLAESIERMCNFVFKDSFVDRTASISELKEKNTRFVNPLEMPRFSQRQLNNDVYQGMKIDSNSQIKWTVFRNLSGVKYLFPCQLTYLGYAPSKNESSLYPSISTGVAGGNTIETAITNGIYESLERDSFMIHYLNQIPGKILNLKSSLNKEIAYLRKKAIQYKLELTCIDFSTDIPVPTIAAIVIDRSRQGRAVSIGLKTDINIEKATIGAITEAFHTRTWVRRAYGTGKRINSKEKLVGNSSLINRGLLWYDIDKIKYLDFWLKSKSIVNYPKEITTNINLKNLAKLINKQGYHIYWKDLTLKEFEKTDFHIVKVVIPELQQLYLNEKFPLLGGKRLKSVPAHLGFEAKRESQLNHFPHPFL